MSIINLENRFPVYRIRMSEDHIPTGPRDPWNFEIPCKRWKARIYPHGGTKLQAFIHTRYVKNALAQLERVGAVAHQVGDDEATVIFEASNFEPVAAVLMPIRKHIGRSAADLNAIRPLEKGRDEGQSKGNDRKAEEETE